MSLSRLCYTRISGGLLGIGYSSSMSCCISISANIVSRPAQAQGHTGSTHAIACLPNQQSLAPS